MRRGLFKRRLPAALIMASMVLTLTSCGTLIHPERRGQPAGRLDPAIVVLDAVGLLLFFVPGVIAFAVDFSTGAIYLPPEHAAALPVDSAHLRTVRMSPDELTPQKIESIVQQETGKNIRLQPGSYRAIPLRQIEDSSTVPLQRLEGGPVSKVLFPSAK